MKITSSSCPATGSLRCTKHERISFVLLSSKCCVSLGVSASCVVLQGQMAHVYPLFKRNIPPVDWETQTSLSAAC